MMEERIKEIILEIINSMDHLPTVHPDGGWYLESFPEITVDDVVDKDSFFDLEEEAGSIDRSAVEKILNSQWYEDQIEEARMEQQEIEYERKYPYKSRGISRSDFY